MRCIEPEDFFPNYIRTYIDRDVRTELGVRKISSFNTFLTLCATRIGEVLNIESLADDCDISVDTARSCPFSNRASSHSGCTRTIRISGNVASRLQNCISTTLVWRPICWASKPSNNWQTVNTVETSTRMRSRSRSSSAFENLEDLAPIMGMDTDHRFVVYGGAESFPTRHGTVLDFSSLGDLIA